TFANLKTTTEHIAETTKTLDGVVQNANTVIESTKQTMGTINSTAGDLRSAIGDARKMLDSARGVLNKAQTGDGPLATLLNNRELAENLKALVANLRTHGILFYKDRAGRTVPQNQTR